MTDTARVALVTGAARGIGAATVHRLAGAGYRVVAVDSCTDDPALAYALGTRAELDAVVAPYGDNALAVTADVRDQAAVQRAVEEAVQTFGGLDAVVAGAGVIAGGEPLWETSDATWDVLHDVCLRGVFHVVRATVPALLARPAPRSGRLVAVASSAAHRGLYHLAAYNSAKSAVVGLVRGLACDLRGTGVTATAVSPGSTRTAMLSATAAVYGLDDIEAFTDSQQTERLAEPDEVAAAIAWLCGPDASVVTGSVLHPDGGFTA